MSHRSRSTFWKRGHWNQFTPLLTVISLIIKQYSTLFSMSDNTIRASILGTGLSLTAFHHPLLKALPELFTVHSVLERSGKETCRSIVGDDVKIVKTYEEVIEDKDVDLVVVSTPNRTHFDYVKRALEAGKHGKSTPSTRHLPRTQPLTMQSCARSLLHLLPKKQRSYIGLPRQTTGFLVSTRTGDGMEIS